MDWTIYTASADITTLNLILNGVAMICNNTAFIWGFAALAAAYMNFAYTVRATIASKEGQAGAVLGKGGFNVFLPFIIASLLTTPAIKVRVNVESNKTGAVTTVDHIPMIIAFIPAGATLLGTELQPLVRTAFQLAGTDYDAISSQNNGFIEPMKMLLNARAGVLRLGAIESQVNSVMASCLTADSGINHATVTAKVQNAKNTGATAAETIAINGATGTSLGALLWQASQNTTGKVLDVIGPDPNAILSCADAATLVADNITNELASIEFGRVMFGSVNGMDDPDPTADRSFNALSSKYEALRTANTIGNTLAGGAQQAQTEVLNLMFSELVKNNLGCLKAEGSNKVVCLAQALQSNEVERMNLQSAARVTPMLMYTGNLANIILALIIGLGPVIILLMMFNGVDSGKSIKASAHMIMWPILVMNVGAEIVNGMMAIKFSNFLSALSQGGYLSQALTTEAYKELAIQIGSASSIMASLPVIMSMIFAMGESSAMVSVANRMTPSPNMDPVTPKAADTAAVFRVGSLGNVTPGVESAGFKMNGALPAVSGSAEFGTLTKEASKQRSAEVTRQQQISEGQSYAALFSEAMRTGNYSRIGVDERTGDALRTEYNKRMQNSERLSHEQGVEDKKGNQNQSGVTVKGGFGSSGLSGGVEGSTQTTATDSTSASNKTSNAKSREESEAIANTISAVQEKHLSNSSGSEMSKTLEKAKQGQINYQRALSESQTNSTRSSEGGSATDRLVSMNAKIGAEEVAQQLSANIGYKMFQTSQGRLFDSHKGAAGYLAVAEAKMASGAIETHSNEGVRRALARQHAAVLMANDSGASAEDRAYARDFLVKGSEAMTGISFVPADTSMVKTNIPSQGPQNNTGVEPTKLGMPAPAVPARQPTTSTEAPAGAPASTPTAQKPSKPARQGNSGMSTPAVPTQQQPAPTATTAPQFPSVTHNVPTPELADRYKLEEQTQQDQQKAKEQGLDGSQGTVRRTAGNVYRNIAGSESPSTSTPPVTNGYVQNARLKTPYRNPNKN